MYLPRLRATPQRRKSVTAFGGYRHDHLAGADRFYDMQNLCADRFPLVSTRPRRGVVRQLSAPNGLCGGESLLFCDGTTLYDGSTAVGQLTNGPKQMVRMGSAVLIWPDKLRYDTRTHALTPLGVSRTAAGATFTMCTLQGDAYGAYSVGTSAPASPTAGALWLDTGDTPAVLRRYSATTGLWSAISAPCVRITGAGIGVGLRAYDGVTISGCTNAAFNGSFLLYGAGNDYILISGTLNVPFTQYVPLTVAREIPDFDFLCEHENRLWGCSLARREIACCKLGDPGNWNCHMGISTDSYTLSDGSEGAFTGCASFAGYVLFFKEDRILKLMGNKPANYQLSSSLCRGVAAGSQKSLCVVNDTLFYHARDGVCAYGGALSDLCGAPLGERFTNAVAGARDGRYYVSMQDARGAWHLFVYDVRCGLWHREDDAQAAAFASCGDQLYMLDRRTNRLMELSGATGALEAAPDWFLQSGELCDGGHLRPRKLALRLQSDPGADVRLLLSYDGRDFQLAGRVSLRRKQPATIPLRLRRCDSLRLRLEGRGACTLHALTLYTEEGSEDGVF